MPLCIEKVEVRANSCEYRTLAEAANADDGSLSFREPPIPRMYIGNDPGASARAFSERPSPPFDIGCYVKVNFVHHDYYGQLGTVVEQVFWRAGGHLKAGGPR